MSNFAFRISVAYEETKLDDLYELCERVIIYQHNADSSVKRTHIHGLIFGCTRKEDTVRNRFFKGKYEYSMKSKVDDKFITYMSKGILEPVYVKGFDPELVRLRTTEWQDHKSAPGTTQVVLVDGKLVKEIPEKKKKTKRELIEIMVSHYEPHMSDLNMLKVIRKVLIDNNEVVGMYKVLDYYDSLLMFGDKSRWLEMMASKINSRIRI